jgi:hypothetical protein
LVADSDSVVRALFPLAEIGAAVDARDGNALLGILETLHFPVQQRNQQRRGNYLPDGRRCFARASGGHGCHACECLSVSPRIDRIRILPVAVACTESTAGEILAAASLNDEVFVLAADAGIQDCNMDAWITDRQIPGGRQIDAPGRSEVMPLIRVKGIVRSTLICRARGEHLRKHDPVGHGVGDARQGLKEPLINGRFAQERTGSSSHRHVT